MNVVAEFPADIRVNVFQTWTFAMWNTTSHFGHIFSDVFWWWFFGWCYFEMLLAMLVIFLMVFGNGLNLSYRITVISCQWILSTGWI